uniref:Integrase catalytic domain-containing protein n=1 Tax=Tanacetum cinerariifolium TaxID=118510 RepID=A0A6L2JW12_TANCI|nr:hypothetical protein [Tanacetum cinerariifolium]
MFTQEEQYTELLEPILEPHQVQQNDSNVISEASSMKQGRGTVDQHHSSIEETHAYFESFYNNLAIKVEKGLPKIDETHALSKPITSNTVPTQQESEVVKNNNVIAPGMFRINPYKPSREERVDNTAKTRRPQPRSNTKNDRVSSASKNSCNKNKEVEVEEHPRNLLLSKNKKHISSECNNVKLAIRNDKYEFVCAMCKQCLITANHDVYVLNYMNDMNSRGKKQKANISNIAKQTKIKPRVKKPKKVKSKKRLASSKPSKPRIFLMWSPIGRIFDICGKIIESIDSKCKSDTSVCDDENASNPQEPTIKQFPNSTSFLGRTNNDTKFKNQILKEYFDSVGISHQVSSVRTPQQNGVVERRNQTLVEAARTMLIFYHASLFLWAEAIATACYTQNPIIHRRFNKTPYELINGRKPSTSFLHVFEALCYPKNDREDIGKLGAKETMNVAFDELLAMAFEQSSSKPGLQGMTSGQISSGLDLTYALSTITTQQPNEPELDLLFKAMYDDYIGGQPLTDPRTILAAQAPQVLQTLTTTTTTADTAPTPTNSSSQATNFPNTSQDVDELKTQQQHTQQQENQALLQPETIADNVPNAMFNGNTFVNPFATPSTSAAESSSSQHVDPSNMHMLHQPYPHEYQWTKDHPPEQATEEPSRPVLIRNQLRSDGEMCMYALTVSTMEPKNVKEAMTDHAWIESMQQELLQFKRLDNHFLKGTIDPTLFIRHFYDDILVVHVYVDDIIFGSTNPSNQSPCGIFINQSNYVLEILKKYGLETCDSVGTLMEIKDMLDLDQNGTLVDATKYHSMIGPLMYLTSSRPDIVHATCLCARYQAKPTEKHLKEVKRIFGYIWGTVNMGLWYTKDSGFELTRFSYANYTGCKDTFKSTSGRSQFLGEKLLTDYGYDFNKIPIYCDSKSAIAISYNPVKHSKTKHIAVRYHFIKEHIEKGTIELYFIKTDYQLANLFSKALSVDRFNYLVCRLGMRSLSPIELERLSNSW